MWYWFWTKLKQTSLVATKIPEWYTAVLIKWVTSFTKDAVWHIVPQNTTQLANGEEFVVAETIWLEWRDNDGKKISCSDKWAKEFLVRIKKI